MLRVLAQGVRRVQETDQKRFRRGPEPAEPVQGVFKSGLGMFKSGSRGVQESSSRGVHEGVQGQLGSV